MSTIFHALILNDYNYAHYADWVKTQKKTIETRMRRTNHRGDVVICCGKTNSVTSNAGKALCIVDLYDCVKMLPEHEEEACIECIDGRFSWMLRDWRYFSKEFYFAKQYRGGPFQGIFKIELPEDIQIIKV